MGIIVEGPDGGGKSTLVAELQSRYPQLKLQNRVVDKNTNAMTDLEKWLEEDCRRPANPTLLYDRHRLISEPIYAPIMGRGFQGKYAEYDWLIDRMNEFSLKRHLVIFCLPPRNVVEHNCQTNPDNDAVVDKAGLIWDAYAALAGRWYGKSCVFDYTNNTKRALDLENLCNWVWITIRNWKG